MDDRDLVGAMRAREPGALAAVYDVYSDILFAYCWYRLRNLDAAQVALRDTFIVAERHLDRLHDPGLLRAWLYALAGAECARRTPTGQARPDIPVASHDQADVDQRTIAWDAVAALDPDTAELLELTVRHSLSAEEVAAVLGRPVRAVREWLETAQDDLEAAVTAVLLIRAGPYGCPDRAVLLQHVSGGEPTAEASVALQRHARECEDCRPQLRIASPARVFSLLPWPPPPTAMRARVLGCFTDPGLGSYRTFVANRMNQWDSAGFPARDGAAAGSEVPSRGRRLVRVAVLTAAGLLLVAALGFAVMHLVAGDHHDGSDVAAHRTSSPTASPGRSSPTPNPRAGGGVGGISPTFPLGATGSAAVPAAVLAAPPTPGRRPQNAPAVPAATPEPARVLPPSPSRTPSRPTPADTREPTSTPTPSSTPTPAATPTPSATD